MGSFRPVAGNPHLHGYYNFTESLVETVPKSFPKLRGHFAEFLNESSLAHLSVLHSTTCVGLRYGYVISG